MARTDLTEAQLEALVRWARTLEDRVRGDQVLSVISEVNRLRDSESTTRWLMELEDEV